MKEENSADSLDAALSQIEAAVEETHARIKTIEEQALPFKECLDELRRQRGLLYEKKAAADPDVQKAISTYAAEHPASPVVYYLVKTSERSISHDELKERLPHVRDVCVNQAVSFLSNLRYIVYTLDWRLQITSLK